MACEECQDLTTHEFRSADDLLHALRTAAQETERGVLERVGRVTLRDAEEEALSSAMDAGALPGAVHYEFRCIVCGDRFTLVADTSDGSGAWTRENES